MAAILRSWLGFLALGAGLVHVALVIGSPLPVAFVLVLVGAAEFVWGVFTFVRTEPPLPQLARSGALVPVIAWALLLVVAGADSFGPLTSPDGLFPMLVASVFDLVIAGIITAMLRRGSAIPDAAATPDAADTADTDTDTDTDTAPSHAGRYLVGVIAGALVIAAITTPALAATEAGQSAQTHGDHGSPTFDLGGHDH